MFHNYPYTDAHELNLDWIIDKIKHIDDTMKETEEFMEAAQAAQEGAETAQEAAETAQGKAEDAQEAAETAQGKAEDAQEAAEDAAEQAVINAEAVVADTLTQINLLQARVDNIIPDGTQTAGNTELLDIRVGADGHIYDSAGNAVRGQVDDLNGEIDNIYSIFSNGYTVFDPDSFTAGSVNLLDGTVTFTTPPATSIIDKHAIMVKLRTDKVKLEVDNGFKVRGVIYDADGVYDSYFNWINNPSSYPADLQNKQGMYVRVYAMKTDGSTLTQEEYDALDSVYDITCENVDVRYALSEKAFAEKTQTNGNYTDFDAIVSNGAYLCNSTLDNGYKGTANYQGILNVFTWNHTNNYGSMQMYQEWDGKVFTRTKWSGTWTSWQALPTGENIKLFGKKIVNFGDSIFGNMRPPQDVSTAIAKLLGATVYNLGFGGCRMSSNSANWDAFSMYQLAHSIATNDFSVQDAVDVDNVPGMPTYFTQTRTLLKSIDFSDVDIVTIAYGTNDFTAGVPVSNSDPDDTDTFAGALRYSIEQLLGAYPNLRIFVCTPTYRFWMDGGGVFTDDSDTHVISGQTLLDFVTSVKNVAEEYHLPAIDNYYELGVNKFNRSEWFNPNDGTHLNHDGCVLIAHHMANELF